MAFQKSSIKLEGNVGDLTFYKQGNTYQVRQRTGISQERITKDPAFQRTRENSQEFGHASHIAKQIRLSWKTALGNLHSLFYDPSVANRLTKRITNVVKSDTINVRGLRRIQPANLRLLNGFSLNSQSALKDAFFLPISPTYDFGQQQLAIFLPSFNPELVIDAPRDTKFFQFHLMVTQLDIENEAFETLVQSSPLTIISKQTESLILSVPIKKVEASILVCCGISFFYESAGYPVPIVSPLQNTLDIIKVYPLPENQ